MEELCRIYIAFYSVPEMVDLPSSSLNNRTASYTSCSNVL